MQDVFTDGRASEHVASQPTDERAVQVQALRRRQHHAQVGENLDDFSNGLRPFKTNEQGCEVIVAGECFLRHTAGVQNEILLIRLVFLQRFPVRNQQIAQIHGRFPRLAAVIQNKGKDRGQFVTPFKFVRLDDVLLEQRGIGQNAHGHPPVLPALELQQKQEVAKESLRRTRQTISLRLSRRSSVTCAEGNGSSDEKSISAITSAGTKRWSSEATISGSVNRFL